MFEWYYGYRHFRDVIGEYVPRSARVLVAGCGNSTMCEDMADDGYRSVLGTDVSRVAIDQQQRRAEEYPEVSYAQLNMCHSFLESESFEAIIDKGLFDAMQCAIGGKRFQRLYVREVLRLLAPSDGVFVLVSHQKPESVFLLLENHDLRDLDFTPWRVHVSTIAKPAAFEGEKVDQGLDGVYFVYACVLDIELVQKKKYRDEKAEKRKKDALGRRTWKPAPPL